MNIPITPSQETSELLYAALIDARNFIETLGVKVKELEAERDQALNCIRGGTYIQKEWIPNIVDRLEAENGRLRLLAYQEQITLEMLYNCGTHPDAKALDLARQMIEKASEALAGGEK